MKLRGNGIVAGPANMMAGRYAAIFQPKALEEARRAAEAGVDLEKDVMSARDVFGDEGGTWEGRKSGGEGTGCGLHENLAVMMTRKIQMKGVDVYRLRWADFPTRSLGSPVA